MVSFITICQALGLMMALVVITRFKEQCWNLLINLMGLIHEETSRFLWQQIGKKREFRQPRGASEAREPEVNFLNSSAVILKNFLGNDT